MLSRNLILAASVVLSACGGGGEDAPPACAQDYAAASWVKESPAAPWQARDSAAHAVLGNRMWLMGGWFDSYSANPRDIWSSTDGKDWQQSPQAPWASGDFAASLSFQNKMWVLGGWSNGRLPGAHASNEVWASADANVWTQSTAPWTPRLGAAAVEFRGRMWLLGGVETYFFGDASSLKNDVWSSDGETWVRSADAPWSPRAFHQAYVFKGRLWVVGGGNYQPQYAAHNDVWSTADGEHWVQSPSAPWASRVWFTTAIYHDAVWVVGGWSNNPYKNYNDVWFSTDGEHWTQSTAPWPPRHAQAMYVFDDRLWVAGGFAAPLINDVWSLKVTCH